MYLRLTVAPEPDTKGLGDRVELINMALVFAIYEAMTHTGTCLNFLDGDVLHVRESFIHIERWLGTVILNDAYDPELMGKIGPDNTRQASAQATLGWTAGNGVKWT